MIHAHDVAGVRAAEAVELARLPAGALMRLAAGGLAAACLRLLGGGYGRRVVLLVGSGDNGGDALYAGAGLLRRGAQVTALLLAPERAHPGGLAAFAAAGGRALPLPELTGSAATDPVTAAGVQVPGRLAALLREADLVVDGIVGIGGQGGLRPVAAAVARLLAEPTKRPVPVVAVDLPSGVDADTGQVWGTAIRADLTVTFGTHKPGLLVAPGAGHAGEIELVDIGLGPHLPEPALTALRPPDVAALLPEPGPSSDKYRRGVVGVVAGSPRYPGAAVLTVGGAIRGGAGYVRLVGDYEVASRVLARWPEAVCQPGPPRSAGRVQAWVVGPGMSTEGEAVERLADVLASDVPVLLDADALTLFGSQFGGRVARSAPTVLTPHEGEAARLLAALGYDFGRAYVEASRLENARRLAEVTGAVVLLKGATVVVAAPGEEAVPVRVNTTGTAWLATAGTGDVLAGLVGSLLAAGMEAVDAASVGAYLHGLAGRLSAGGGPVTAQAVGDALPAAWRSVRG